MVGFTVRIHVAWLIGLAALLLTVSAAHGQGRSMRMRQGTTVRQSPRNSPFTGQARSFSSPRQLSSDPFVARRFDRFQDRFGRDSSFARFDRFEDRFERRFGFDPFLGRQFGFNPFLATQFGINPFLASPFGINPFLASPFGINPFLVSPFGFNPFLVSPFGLNPFLGL